MQETWFVMEDGSAGDPREIAADKDGVLRHKDGRAVAMAAHGPRSRGVDPEKERAKVEAAAEKAKADASKAKAKEAKPEDAGKTYRTREIKGG